MTHAKPAFTQTSRLMVAAAALLMALATALLPGAAWASSQSVDATRTGTLVITQLEAGHETRPGTGLPQDTSDQVPVPGVKFTVTKVPGIDSTTNEGWAEAQELTAKQAAERVKDVSPTASGVTDSKGELVFSGLPLGLYYVDPVSAPGGCTTGSPFLVALPMTDPDS